MVCSTKILLSFLACVCTVSAAPELFQHKPLEQQLQEDALPDGGMAVSEEAIDKIQAADDQPPMKNNGAVTHGSTIAIQALYDKLSYLDCTQRFCRKGRCPGLYMEGNDWRKCSGQVFTIYRKKGAGDVRVGDQIGIYFPREPGFWLGCAGKQCIKASCPGQHSCTNGFSKPSRWSRCYGEVFKIYARGKSVGALIKPSDHVMLYYPKAKNWIGLVGNNNADHRTCPGRVLPPSPDKYDKCWGEVFELFMYS